MKKILENEQIRDENIAPQSYIEISPLTGLYFGDAFFQKADDFLEKVSADTYCMVAIDLEHFRLFNKLYGRTQGDLLIVAISDILKKYQEKNSGIIGYLGGDNFGFIVPYNQENLKKLRHEIADEVKKWSNSVGFLPAFGIYPITDTHISAANMYDRATIALSNIIGNYTKRSCIYSPDMEEKVEEEIRLLSDIQRALDEEEFTFFVQPQCDISTGKIVGGESLVRWKHRTRGLISPGLFVPVLEKNGFIANLDRYVWKKVCEWLRSLIDRGFQPIPISVNVSRIDIFSMDVHAYLTELVETYKLPARLLKVEITESAYAESNDRIIRTVKQLRDADFLVMMDDFGSGYSSLNMLKSVAVDVLKIDMRFLDINENEEEKGIGILESVVNMARQMQMPIVVEGVENQTQENFLLKMGCRYTQGYYYYKPMPIEDFEKLISNKSNLDLNGIWCRQIEALHLKEFLDPNLFNDATVNNILGASAFYDMYENTIEITRVNEQYHRLAGISSIDENNHNKKFWNHVRDDDRQLLFTIFAQAYDNQSSGAEGYIHYLRTDGVTLWIYLRVFFLREKDGHKLFFGSLTDLTALHNKKIEDDCLSIDVIEITEHQRMHMDEYYGNLPFGYAVGKLSLDEANKPVDYEIIYANHDLKRISGGDIGRLRYLMLKLFSNNIEEMLKRAYRAAYLGEKVEFNIYSQISCRYLHFTLYQYQYGYVSCILQDVTHSHIYENTLNNILLSYREVYFLHLQENYLRMIYPDENHLLERGNYEEAINRHFGTGRILPYDKTNVRNFLSLENLREVLKKQDTAEYKYRRSIHGAGEEWCLTTVNICERINGIPKTAILTIRSIEALMREKEEIKHENMAQVLANMSEGFFIYNATGNEKILYANPTVLKIYGCDNIHEFRELVNNSFQGMVYPEDLNRVQWEIHEQVKQSDRKMDFIRYRITRKDGQIRWIDDCGHLEDSASNHDDKLFYVFISDITETISEEQKQKLIAENQLYNQ